MKSLELRVIMDKINGRLFNGSNRYIVNDLVTRTHRLQNGSLLLDIYKEKDLTLIKNSEKIKCSIVTDTPCSFLGLGENITIIKVPDIREAAWDFIEYYRSLFTIPIIGVTGTCGKTTTKEMIKHILSRKFKIKSTYKSYNSLFRNLGYLMEIDDQTEAAVYEMGVAYPKDLKTSCRFFKPQVGVITNIGIDHIQGCKTLEDYIQCKAEFLEGLGFEGCLVLNGDDENIKKMDLVPYRGRVLYFGVGENTQFKVLDIRAVENGHNFKIQHEDKIYDFFIPGLGEFNVYNAVAAIAASYAVGVDIKEAGDSLLSFKHIEKHLAMDPGILGSTIIDDTWSSNPTSAEAALRLLKSVSQGKKTIAVLGKMSLLGEDSAKYHFRVGEIVAENGINTLLVNGYKANEIGLGAIKAGMKEENIHFCLDANESYKILKNYLDENTIVLVKTSMLDSYGSFIDKILLARQEGS